MRYQSGSFSKVFYFLAVGFFTYSASHEVHSQEVKGKTSLEEVIVTAQRREENLQDVAISMTVFSEEAIANANMVNSSDIATYTPSLTTNARFGNEMTSFAIRGFTQDLRTAASVGVYFAEVVAPRGAVFQVSGDGAGPGALFDLQNIQVLKGPQGTLFGRNTTGGSILLTPNKPEGEFEGYVEVTEGEFDTRRLQAVLNTPFNERIKVRLGLDKNQRDGHLTNTTGIGADKLGNTDYLAARLSIVLNITDNFENYTILSYADTKSNGYSQILFNCNTDPSNPFYSFIGAPCQTQLDQQSENHRNGFYDLASTVKTLITTIEEKRFINTSTWDISENLTVKNIFSYAHLKGLNSSDNFGTTFYENFTAAGNPALPFPLPALSVDPRREFHVGVNLINPAVPTTSQEVWIEEIQLQGSAFDSRLVWQSGAYYEHSTPDGESGNISASFLYCEMASLESLDSSRYNCNDPLGGQLGGVLHTYQKNDFLNKAVYTQATYDLLDSFSVTAGFRFTKDVSKGDGRRYRFTYLGTAPQAPIYTTSSAEVKSSAPTGLLEFDYHPSQNVMLYAKYIRGYRQGGVNLAADPGLDTHKEETVDTYEIGAKSSFEWVIPFRFNFSLFDNKLHDMQLQNGYISAAAGPTTSISNAGEAEIKGFEIEATAQLFEDLRLNLSYSWLNTELLKQSNVDAQKVADAVTAATGSPVSGQLAATTFTPVADVGDELPFAPERSWVASLDYRLPTPVRWGMINLGVTYVYTGEQRATATSSSPSPKLEEFDIFNLNASWHDILGSNFDMTFFGTNILDNEYVTYISGSYYSTGAESRQVGFPKLYGFRLKYNFN